MKSLECPHESAVSHAVRGGHWTDALREHAGGCPVCRETSAVAGWLQDAARSDGGGVSMPDAELIWLQSRVIERERSMERTLLPLRVVEAFAVSTVLVGILLSIDAPGPLLEKTLSDVITSGEAVVVGLLAESWNSTPEVAVLAWPAIVVFLAIMAVLAVFAATYPLLSED